MHDAHTTNAPWRLTGFELLSTLSTQLKQSARSLPAYALASILNRLINSAAPLLIGFKVTYHLSFLLFALNGTLPRLFPWCQECHRAPLWNLCCSLFILMILRQHSFFRISALCWWFKNIPCQNLLKIVNYYNPI
jgi:hypothetical protein